jgi:two-component system sensor histidine kinase QseC
MTRVNTAGTGTTLTRHLLAWALGTMLVLWGVFVYLGYQTGEHESEELTDGHLATVVALLLAQNEGANLAPQASANPPALPVLSMPGASLHNLRAHDYQQSLSVLIWNAEGALLRRIGPAPAVPFDTPDGFALLKLGAQQKGWRSFSRWDEARSQRVMVLISEEERDALAADIAEQIGEPAWWLLPLMLLALGLAIHRGLQPLRELSSKVHELEVLHPQPLALKSRHEELRSAVEAINSLVDKYGQALARERQLADAFAHELRTPLTALGLHVDQLRSQLSQGSPAVQQVALSQIETQARRANQVLTHLLALARAGRTSMEEAARPLDLVAMSRTVIADHLPAADAAGHELSFAGDEEVWVQGHPVLVEIALRNLLENAIAHAPAASQIEVQANAAAKYLQVCDGPRSASTADPKPAESHRHSRLSLGLGLGHQVIQRIGDVHGASFEEVASPSGFRRCYRLSFP